MLVMARSIGEPFLCPPCYPLHDRASKVLKVAPTPPTALLCCCVTTSNQAESTQHCGTVVSSGLFLHPSNAATIWSKSGKQLETVTLRCRRLRG